MRPQNVWVRVLYLQPEGMSDELIETIRDTPEVLPYIDIPVQHCDARILKAMRRSGSRQELEDLFRDLRERIPGIVIRSTAMVGFPTETDDEFRDLIDFMDTVGFDYTSVFAYSQEEGSLAAKMEGQVDEEVKLERAQEAMDLAESLGFAATAAHVGERAQVIVDGIEETEDGAELIGHAWFQAPDSDGAVQAETFRTEVSCHTALNENGLCEAVCMLQPEGYASAGSGTVELRYDAVFQVQTFSRQKLQNLSGGTLDLTRQQNTQRPSVVIRRISENAALWDLARQYRTTAQSIQQANHLTQPEADAGQLLLIPM